MSLLPSGATKASRLRFDLATRLAELCPQHLGRELALTGSASRGVADEDSDIELVAWVDAMPTKDERDAWLAEIGGTDVAPETHTSQDGTVWHWSRFQDTWLEAGWQSITTHERVLQSILAGDEIDHRRLTVTDAVIHAVPLRTDGSLSTWQQQLADYPEVLRDRLLNSGSRRWTTTVAYWALARRGDRVAAAERIVADVQSVLRMVFALNRVWEPAWKWSPLRTAALLSKPDRLMERLDTILSMSDLDRSLTTCAELFLDTLRLVPADVDVSDAVMTIERGLRERAP